MPISRRLLITSTLAFLLVGAAALLFLVAASFWLSQRTQTYAYDEHVELVHGSKYVLALGHNDDGTYTIGPAGFAVFQLGGGTLSNDITGNKYAYEDLRLGWGEP